VETLVLSLNAGIENYRKYFLFAKDTCEIFVQQNMNRSL